MNRGDWKDYNKYCIKNKLSKSNFRTLKTYILGIHTKL